MTKSTLRLLQPALFSSLFLVNSLAAREIVIDSTLATVTDAGTGLAYDFDGRLHSITRRPDRTLQLTIQGDLVLSDGDTLRGVGRYPVVILVGNDAIIDPGATIDFSAINLVPGAGGGAGKSGGIGGRGGAGGRGGNGGRFGLGGLGGTLLPTTLRVVNLTTPGLPAGRGRVGEDGGDGKRGSGGEGGTDGAPGFGLRGTAVGAAGSSQAAAAPVAGGANGGAGGQRTNYAPKIFFLGEGFREFVYGSALRNLEDFREAEYNGGDGGNGDSAGAEPDPTTGHGGDGDGGRNDGASWALTGGSSGGSGAGGSGGPGGGGGGGGGGGAGGQGEWMEPFPTSELGLLVGSVKTGLDIKELIEIYLDRKKEKKEDEGFKLEIPSIDIGATGGFGGRGSVGQDGTHGGRGGDGGAGGGALRIVAQEKVLLNGDARSRGGHGVDGTAGSTTSAPPNFPVTYYLGSDPFPSPSLTDLLLDLFGSDIRDNPNAGKGGRGGTGGSGAKGGRGSAGGRGGAGAGGTIIFEGTEVVTAGTVDLRGGDTYPDTPDPPIPTAGEAGRLFIATNALAAGTSIKSLIPSERLFPSDYDSSTRPGTAPAPASS